MIKLNTFSFESSSDLKEARFKEVCEEFVLKQCKRNNIHKLSLVYGELFLDDNVQIQVTQSQNYENTDASDLARLLRFDSFIVLGDRKNICLWVQDEEYIFVMFNEQHITLSMGDGWTVEDNSYELTDTDFYDVFLKHIENE